MKGRRVREHHVKGAPAAADLLVCFPSRAHLSLMPKPICSPARPSEPNKRPHHLHRLKKSATRGSAGQASPLMWAKSKSLTQGGAEMVSEPTSPKVTCAGQIKVRHKAGTCKSWQSVMEEIEKIHKSSSARNKQRKPRTGWTDALGFKKEVMQFLTCLRTIRFDFRCFGSFHGADITTDDDDDDEYDEEEDDVFEVGEDRTAKKPEEAPAESSRTVFSKWFMVLQEEQNNQKLTTVRTKSADDDLREGIISAGDGDGAPAVPPPNALLLMRCRSAPAKSWLEEREEEEEEEEEEEREVKVEEEEEEEEDGNEKLRSNRSLRYLMDEDEKRKTKESVVVMRYQYYEADSDSYKFSSDIAKETWVVGGVRDPLSRSRSWKR